MVKVKNVELHTKAFEAGGDIWLDILAHPYRHGRTAHPCISSMIGKEFIAYIVLQYQCLMVPSTQPYVAL